MRHRFYHRWFVFLGLLAMVGALLSMPLAATYAHAMSGKASVSASAATQAQGDEMPCHKKMKKPPCPNCPQKVCPEMGSCLIKCFQPLPAPVSETGLHGHVIADRVAPAIYTVPPSSLTPPLLRPPSL